MTIDFNAACYMIEPIDRRELIEKIYRAFTDRGFEYRSGRGCAESYQEQLQRISNGEDNFLWLKEDGKSILVGLYHVQSMKLGEEAVDNISVFSASFSYEYITSESTIENQNFLNRLIEILEVVYRLTKSDLMWAGYSDEMPSLNDYHVGLVRNIFWFNIFGKRFVDNLGRIKLLSAPGWRIKELPDGSVVVQLSDHPHLYEKKNDLYLHEYLGLDYIG